MGNVPASLVDFEAVSISHHSELPDQIADTSITHVCHDRTVPRDLLAAQSKLLPFVKVWRHPPGHTHASCDSCYKHVQLVYEPLDIWCNQQEISKRI